MGCCSERQKFKFLPGDEFGDAYNKYVDLDDQHQEIIKSTEKMAEQVKKDPMYVLNNIDQEMGKMGNQLQVELQREQAFKNLEATYKKLKDSNQLGADEALKTEKYNEVLSLREKDIKKLEKQVEDLNKEADKYKNLSL